MHTFMRTIFDPGVSFFASMFALFVIGGLFADQVSQLCNAATGGVKKHVGDSREAAVANAVPRLGACQWNPASHVSARGAGGETGSMCRRVAVRQWNIMESRVARQRTWSREARRPQRSPGSGACQICQWNLASRVIARVCGRRGGCRVLVCGSASNGIPGRT